MNKLIKKVEAKIGRDNVIDNIVEKISGSELNSFLLELFKKKSSRIKPSTALREYEKNRFGFPSIVDPIKFKKEEVDWLERASIFGFRPIILSPLTPLGTSSTVALVDQNNIVSATRGTEVVSDATNVLALKLAADLRISSNNGINKYCTTHRHVRGQFFTNPAYSAHFGLFCMATSGKDIGDYKFELENLENHLEFYFQMLGERFAKENLLLKIFSQDFEKTYNGKLSQLIYKFITKNSLTFLKEEKPSGYYKDVQFKFYVKHNNIHYDFADGGFVDWTQKLLSNEKLRLLTSASGIELIVKIIKQQV